MATMFQTKPLKANILQLLQNCPHYWILLERPEHSGGKSEKKIGTEHTHNSNEQERLYQSIQTYTYFYSHFKCHVVICSTLGLLVTSLIVELSKFIQVVSLTII